MPEQLIRIKLSSRLIYAALITIILLNAGMLAATKILHSARWEEGSGGQLILGQLDLANENTIATWYSSMLLLLVALLANHCFFADRQHGQPGRGRVYSYGWLVFAFIFGTLSLDEIGSFHERMGNEAKFKLFGGLTDWYLFLGLIGAAALFMVVFCWSRFRQTPWALVCLTGGVLLFLTLRVQETLEEEIWNFGRPVNYTILEEGTEIFGSLCFLMAVTVYARYLSTRKTGSPASINFSFLLPKKTAFIYALLFIGFLSISFLAIQYTTQRFEAGDKGLPHNWFPSALAFGVTLIALYLYHTNKKRNSSGAAYLLIALFSLLVSLLYGSNIYAQFTGQSTPVSWVLSTGSVLIGFNLLWRINNRISQLGLVVWLVLFNAAMSVASAFAAELGFIAYAVLLLSLISSVYQPQPAQKKAIN